MVIIYCLQAMQNQRLLTAAIYVQLLGRVSGVDGVRLSLRYDEFQMQSVIEVEVNRETLGNQMICSARIETFIHTFTIRIFVDRFGRVNVVCRLVTPEVRVRNSDSEF